ncbi:ABC transporter permease [Jeotgalibacillus proteolyticus]|uniref:Sugar ABC transporter permease n=1 Tax=Jeotgalibacillus proteolyticus TaxID=2082395 RepID=A0A2S5GGF3_9BACL|nr:ABC transporter permease [Jeotgalibacillus proteolyticus]PPA72004.1 sugar ABC transporter permease [Jeotgalibacillus proteolyticus]
MDILTAIEILVKSMLFASAPLIFTALGGVISERSGVVNIGLEGLMVIGAFSAVVFNITFASAFGAATPWVALLIAMGIGGLFSLIHAVASITFRADHVVSGVAINFLALGLGVYLVKAWYGAGQTAKIPEPLYYQRIPLLYDIPVIGPILFNNYVTSYLAIFVAVLVWFLLFKTPFGLRLRSVGEHPLAADTMGINVYKMRYIAVVLSGVMGGLGGGVYAQTITQDFSASTITGQGFIALAAVIFGKWHPLGAMGAALFFGLAQSLAIIGSSFPFLADVPNWILLSAPYILTILALAGFIGRADAPKAVGTPYIKGKR